MIAKIRKDDKDTKIIVMSAHSEQEKLLQAIKLHLESYLIKPIKMDALKKVLFETVDLIRKTTSRTYATENMFWDGSTNTLWYNSKEIKLRKMENLLLKLLFSKPSHCFSAKDIFDYLHEEKDSKEFSTHAVTSLMKRIRVKLPEDIIQNIYGSGYRVVTL
jgi:DNA-binding response OmpR family regulator